MHYCGECSLIEIECFITHLAQYLHSASGCPPSMKPVTHQQAGWHVITLSVQAIHYII